MKKTIITILIIILIALLGLVAYQWFNKENEKVDVIDENVEINNGFYVTGQSKDTQDNIYLYEDKKVQFVKLDKLNYLTDEDKKDSNLPFVYKIFPKYTDEKVTKNLNGKDYIVDYKQFRNEFEIVEDDELGIISVPYLNLNVKGIDKVNYILKAICLNENSLFEFAFCPDTCYSITIKDDILSIYLKGFATNKIINYNFNIDLKNKKVLSNKEFFDKLSLNEDDIKKIMANAIVEAKNITSANDFISAEVYSNKLYDEFINEINDEELLYGYKIDLNKDLNDYCKYDFNKNNVEEYVDVVNHDCKKIDGTNNIFLMKDNVIIKKYIFDSFNNNYFKIDLEMK